MVLGLIIGAAFTWRVIEVAYQTTNSFEAIEIGEVATSSDPTAEVLGSSEPVTLHIPKLALDIPFEPPLGLKQNGEIEVPRAFDTVGWYKYGVTPGERGPAVVLGHVDSYKGPAVFYSLGQLEVGDEVAIDREDGTTAVFRVTGYERVSQSEFPTERVYGAIDHAGLRLITCTGTYSRTQDRYSHNLIVYADLVTEDEKGNTQDTAEAAD